MLFEQPRAAELCVQLVVLVCGAFAPGRGQGPYAGYLLHVQKNCRASAFAWARAPGEGPTPKQWGRN